MSLGEIEAVHRAGLSDFRRVARAVLGSEEAARDAVQDGFAGAIRDRRAYRGAAASEVLYMDFFDRRSGCCRVLSSGEVRLWVDGANPRHFRTVFPGFPEGSPLAEGGGTVEGSLFRYDPSANVLERLRTGVDVSATSFDPVATVRDALAAGRARVTGDAVVDGRRVTRIELTARDARGTPGTVIYDVDPNSYQPVAIEYPRLVELRFPFEPVFGNGIYKESVRFVAFRYLPATNENLRLADIRAMHPTARVGR